jgi:hypothetical protein
MARGIQTVQAPLMAATIYVPAAGTIQQRVNQQKLGNEEVFQFDIRPTKVRLESNNYLEADQCDVTFAYDEAGLDPRLLRSAEGYVYIVDSHSFGGPVNSADNLRFIGIARDVTREFNPDERKTITIRFQDYTCLFLEMKNFPDAGIPSFSMTIQQAWEHICDHTGYWDLDTHEIQSSVENLKDRLIFQGDIDPTITLGSAVPQRIARLGKPIVDHASDAWAVWQAVIGSLGLISFVRGDQVIVTTATDFYTASDPPRFLYGLNILKLTESREVGQLSNKLIAVRAYDPLAKKTLESLYPNPNSGLARRKKKLGASAKKAPKTVTTQDYELLDLPFAVASQDQLDNIAQRIWEERTRQELHGTLTTREMFVDTAQGSQHFDLLQLAAGDQIQVEIEQDALDDIQSLPTVQARLVALLVKGYSPSTANYIASNLDGINSLGSQFLVHSVVTELEAMDSGEGKFEISVDFLNRIQVDGSAQNEAKGTDVPPLANQKIAG